MARKKKPQITWEIIHRDMTDEGVQRAFLARREYSLAKDRHSATTNDNYKALAIAIRDRIIERWISTQQKYHKDNSKRVYYLSMEFLIGRLLGTNILNLGIWEEVKSAMESLGIDLEELRDCEIDAGLGNGGLGRLAACFLDSMAMLGIPAHGYGIRYEYGIFNQKIVNGYQVERPDEWLNIDYPWEFQRLEYANKIKFYGHTETLTDKDSSKRVIWVDTEDLLAVPYDIPISGYKTDTVNTLRLWSARSSEEFDFQYFNDGDYEKAVCKKVDSETISKVLYPNDNFREGKELRLKQEYFFTAASISDIIRRFKVENTCLSQLPQKAAIQLNDTHPALAIPELLRILIDQEGFNWDQAWDIITRTFSYTNHTLMPEALERWPVSMFENLLPRHMELIYEINRKFIEAIKKKFPNDEGKVKRMSLIEEGEIKKIRMASMCIVGSHSVNGVSKLHTELLKSQLFKDFYEFSPEKFNNKTNGITQRRWLDKSNPRLSSLITGAIGDGWLKDATCLSKLSDFKYDASFKERWQDVKSSNKKDLAKYIHDTTGITVNEDSIFDVQIKRMHEYKRQLLFSFFMINQYLRVKNNPKAPFVPRTFIVGGKAAPGYFMAKQIIKFINNIGRIINSDKTVSDKLKVVFLENYRVSLAEKIFPASDLSEQISTAGYEASGTGNMKFMINGALTIGTYDGANIEIAENVGEENIFIFGLRANEVGELKRKGYKPQDYIKSSKNLKEIIALIKKNFFSVHEKGIFDAIWQNLVASDNYLICADFEDYCRMQDIVSKEYSNKSIWMGKSIENVAKSGTFSSDRTIKEYASQIWNIPCNFPPK
jgi:glycogen phosphorylase